MGDQKINLTKEYIQEEDEDPAQDIVEEEMQQFNLLVSGLFVRKTPNHKNIRIDLAELALVHKILELFMCFLSLSVQFPREFHPCSLAFNH